MALIVSTCLCGARWLTFDQSDVDDPKRGAGWCPSCEDALFESPGPMYHYENRRPSYLHGWHLIEEARWPTPTSPPTRRSTTTP